MYMAEHSSEQAIRTLYQDHHRWLYQWLIRYVGCSENARDIAQDTFVRILNSRDAVLGMREPRAFLATTAKRLLIDQSRRKKLEQAWLAELEQSVSEYDETASPERLNEVLEALQIISQALDDLPEKPRMAFLLHYLEGQNHSSIARQLKVTPRMVHKYLVKALLHCHNAYEY